MKSRNKPTDITIHVPLGNNSLLEKALANINDSKEVRTLWKVIDVNALDRLGMTDHGPVHFQIVSNIALRLARILVKNKVIMSVVEDFELSNNHAELIILWHPYFMI